MKYMPTDVAGVTIIDIEPDRDDRGFFSNVFCADEFAEYGLLFNVSQTSVAYNYARGTLRGIHRQVPPNAVATLVRCTRGAIVAVAQRHGIAAPFNRALLTLRRAINDAPAADTSI